MTILIPAVRSIYNCLDLLLAPNPLLCCSLQRKPSQTSYWCHIHLPHQSPLCLPWKKSCGFSRLAFIHNRSIADQGQSFILQINTGQSKRTWRRMSHATPSSLAFKNTSLLPKRIASRSVPHTLHPLISICYWTLSVLFLIFPSSVLDLPLTQTQGFVLTSQSRSTIFSHLQGRLKQVKIRNHTPNAAENDNQYKVAPAGAPTQSTSHQMVKIILF